MIAAPYIAVLQNLRTVEIAAHDISVSYQNTPNPSAFLSLVITCDNAPALLLQVGQGNYTLLDKNCLFIAKTASDCLVGTQALANDTCLNGQLTSDST